MNLAPYIRIALRVAAGYLIGKGADPELANTLYTDPQIAGAIALAISEGWYFIAKKYGGAT